MKLSGISVFNDEGVFMYLTLITHRIFYGIYALQVAYKGYMGGMWGVVLSKGLKCQTD